MSQTGRPCGLHCLASPWTSSKHILHARLGAARHGPARHEDNWLPRRVLLRYQCCYTSFKCCLIHYCMGCMHSKTQGGVLRGTWGPPGPPGPRGYGDTSPLPFGWQRADWSPGALPVAALPPPLPAPPAPGATCPLQAAARPPRLPLAAADTRQETRGTDGGEPRNTSEWSHIHIAPLPSLSRRNNYSISVIEHTSSASSRIAFDSRGWTLIDANISRRLLPFQSFSPAL